jgi:hypothetical protein
MNRSVPEVRASDRPTGLIDTLQAGFNAVNRNVWLLIIPIAVDLFLWWGPQPTAGPMLERWLSQAPPPQLAGSLGSNFEDNRRAAVESLRRGEGVARYNLLAFLAPLPMGVPAFMAPPLPFVPAQVRGEGPSLPLDSPISVLAVVLASIVLGLMLATLFYGLLAQGVREGRAGLKRFLPDLPQLTVWVGALFLLVIAAIVVATVPFIALFVATQTTGPQSAAAAVASVAAAILFGVGLWAFIYLFFTPHALYVAKIAPFSAIQNSILIVRYNFWSAVGLILLMFLISEGLSVVWQQLTISVRTAGLAMSIVGHIYISAGLAASGMTYYKERFERLRPAS